MKPSISSSVLAGMLLASSSAYSATTNTSKAVENGVPFQQLNKLISENRALIDSNQTAVANLTNEVNAMHLRVDALETNLAGIAAQVSDNTQDIAEAFQRIASNSGDVAGLRADLSALVQQHNADMTTLHARLDGIDLEIANLSAQGLELANLLNQRVAELRASIDNNALGIDALLLDVISINAQITTINSQINSLFIQQSSLSDQLADLAAQLANLQASVDALKVGASPSSLPDPCIANISVGQSIVGQLVNNGICISVVQTNGGAHPTQFYTFTLANPTTVRIAMQGQPSGNGTLPDPYLYLHQGNRSGAVIRSNDDNGINYDSQIDTLLQPGIYTIEATSYSATQLGSFLLSLTAP